MLACLENTIDAADGTDDLPGNMRTMICSGEHPRRVEIAAPVKTHGCHSHSRGQMERTRVVGDHHAATTQEARQSAKRDTLADILRLRFHRAHDLRLEVDVGYPPIKGNGIWGFQANRDFRPQVEQERVGITTTPMDLESQIKVLLPHGFKKPLLLNRIVS